MTGPDHYRLAEELLTDREVLDEVIVGTAQVHATLALAAATAMPSDFGNRAGADTWCQAGGQATSVLGEAHARSCFGLVTRACRAAVSST